MDFSYRDPKSKPMYMANLEVMEILDTEKCDLSEGCLSVPEMYAPVGRPRKIRYRYLNRDNVLIEDIAEDIVSICVQHEIDHLDGKLFIDRLSPLKRQFILNKMNKRK
jgi:peptide deformylase